MIYRVVLVSTGPMALSMSRSQTKTKERESWTQLRRMILQLLTLKRRLQRKVSRNDIIGYADIRVYAIRGLVEKMIRL